MQNVSFRDPSNALPIILHGDFTDFRERVAQKLLYAVVYWAFSGTFLDIRVKWPEIPAYLLSYLVLFEIQNSIVAALKIPIKPKEYWWFREAIFQRKSKSAAWRSNRIQVFGPGAHSGPKWRQGASEYQENDSKTKHSGPHIFNFSRNQCKKPT